MRFQLVIVALCLALASLAMPVQGAGEAQSAMVAVCAPPYTVTATANIGAGNINFCLYFPATVYSATSTFQIVGVFNAPATVLPAFNAASAWFTPNSGCTEGTPAMVVPTINGITGTTITFSSILTMTSEQCDGTAGVQFSIGAPTLEIYRTALPLTVQTENHRVDNFEIGCDDSNAVINNYNPATFSCIEPHSTMAVKAIFCASMDYNGTCTTPTINAAITGTLTATLAGTLALSGTVGLSQSGAWAFTLNGIPDTQQEIQAIADALAAGLDVSICQPSAPCYHVLSGSLDTNSTTTIANQSAVVNIPDHFMICGPGSTNATCTAIKNTIDIEHSGDHPGLAQWLLIVFWIAAIMFFWWLDSPFGMGFAIVGLLDAIDPAIPGSFVTYLAFCLLAVVLEYFAGEKIRAAWKNRKKMK